MKAKDSCQRSKEMEDVLNKWLELGERMMRLYCVRIDANMGADFTQGIQETKELLGKVKDES